MLFPLSILRSEGAVPRISCSLPPCCCDPQHVIHTHTHTHTHTPGLRRPQQRGRARVIASAAFSNACLTPRLRACRERERVVRSSHEQVAPYRCPRVPAGICMYASRAMRCACILHTRVPSATRAYIARCMCGRQPLLAVPQPFSQQLADTTYKYPVTVFPARERERGRSGVHNGCRARPGGGKKKKER